MKLIETCCGEGIHDRHIAVTTHECDDSFIVVVGELRDRRLVKTYRMNGLERDPSTVHHMRIALKVSVSDLTIEEVEVELPEVPHGECSELVQSLEGIRGMRISPGFTSRVKRLVGGRQGCIHLTTLLLAMAPAAIQGFWVHNDRKIERRTFTEDLMDRYLIDTCRVWRREGPLAREIAETAGIEIRTGAKAFEKKGSDG